MKVDYYAMLRDPRSSNAKLRSWLQEKGVPIGLSSVRDHRTKFRARLDKVRQSAELAHMFVRVAREQGAADMSDAVVGLAEQKMMQTLFSVLQAQPKGEEFAAKQWQEVHKAIALQVKNRAAIEAVRGSLEDRKRKSAGAKSSKPNKAQSSRQVADRVREILGVPPASDAG